MTMNVDNGTWIVSEWVGPHFPGVAPRMKQTRFNDMDLALVYAQSIQRLGLDGLHNGDKRALRHAVMTRFAPLGQERTYPGQISAFGMAIQEALAKSVKVRKNK
jgi:hypothetical protein